MGMKAEKLRPFPSDPRPPAPEPLPRCESSVQVSAGHDAEWRRNRYPDQPFRCTRPSVVRIAGHCYCRLHGGHKALELLLNGKLKEVR